MSYYPPYAPHLEKPAKPLTPEAVEAAPAPEAVEVQEYHRKHGELPPGVTPQDLQKVQMTLKDRLTEKYAGCSPHHACMLVHDLIIRVS